MSVSTYMRRGLMSSAALVLGVWVFAGPAPVGAQPAPAIRFAAEVPAAPAQMRIYNLAPSRAPIEFFNEKLKSGKLPALQLQKGVYVARGATGRDDRDKVRAFVDPKSGDATFTPSLADLVRASAPRQALPAERAVAVGRAALADVRFIPKDATELRVSDAVPLMGGATAQGAPNAPPARTEVRQIMTMVPADRYAGGFRVYGRGSRALVSIGNDGAIVGAIRHWRTASPGQSVVTSVSAQQVQAEITRQLRPQVAARGVSAVVDRISIGYYDGNAKYLQPVYYFEATLHSAEKAIGDTKIAGYVPIGKALEPIPDLAAKPPGPGPATPKPPTPSGKPVGKVGGPGIPGDISLGEYANQDWPTSSAYLTMANSFLNGLTFLNSIFPGITPPTARTQWYTAHNWEVVGPSSRYYMNAVNVAYTEPHGDWLINSTLSNCCENWYVPNIGTGGNPGYGAAAGGVLATWLIMSCEVIPSMYDRQNEQGGTGNPYMAFDAWWGVFKGLHNVLGFRTIMFYPDDSLNWGFGYSASFGGDVNAAWFQSVAAYDGNDGTYASQHLKGGITVHYDRASSMVDARDLGQSIYSVGAQSASSTLWNFWMGN